MFYRYLSILYLMHFFLIEYKLLPEIPSDNINDLSSVEQRAGEITALLGEYQNSTLNFKPTPNPLLSDLMYSFFRFYTRDFDFKIYAMSLSHTSPVRKAVLGWPHSDLEGKVVQGRVVILNPYSSENMGQSVTKDDWKRIKSAFRAACVILLAGRAKPLFHKFPKAKKSMPS